jgi:hypothetical protein
VQRVLLVKRVLQARRVIRVIPAQLDRKVSEVTSVLLVLKVLLDLKAQLDQLVRKEN